MVPVDMNELATQAALVAGVVGAYFFGPGAAFACERSQISWTHHWHQRNSASEPQEERMIISAQSYIGAA